MTSPCGPVILDWQIAKMTNCARARHMLETSLFADCEFLVASDDGVEEVYLNFWFSLCKYMLKFFVCVCVCTQLIKAHRTFLAMGSPVFQAMFYGGMAQAVSSSNVGQNKPITIPDLQPSAFKALLE